MSDSQKAINSDSGGIKTKWIIVTICLIILIVLGLYFVNFPHHLSDKNEVWGTFGDYFGGILNPVIAAFVFYFVVESYKLQKTELKETRKLLEVSTTEQKNQIKLAALTAIFNVNLKKIEFLESEKEIYKDIPQSHINLILRKQSTDVNIFMVELRSEFQDFFKKVYSDYRESPPSSGQYVWYCDIGQKIDKEITDDIIKYILGDLDFKKSEIVHLLVKLIQEDSCYNKKLQRAIEVFLEINNINNENDKLIIKMKEFL